MHMKYFFRLPLIITGLLLMRFVHAQSPADDQRAPVQPMAAPQPFILKAQPPGAVAVKVPNPVTVTTTIAPAHPEERLDLADIDKDLRAGRQPQAIAKLEAIIEKNPSQFRAWEKLGWIYWKAGRQDDTLKLWGKLVELDPDLPAGYNLLGQAYSARNDLSKAATYYAKSLSLEPEQFDVAFALANIARWTGDMDHAIELYRALLPRNPKRTMDVKLELARALQDNRNYEEAVPLWAEIVRQYPTNQEYMVRDAAVLLYTGHIKESQELAAKVLARDPANLQIYLMQADLAERSEHPEEAAEPLRKIVQLAQDDQLRKQARTRLIRLLVNLHKKAPLSFGLNEPIQLVRDILHETPNNVDANLMLGELRLMELRYAEAESLFLHVLTTYNVGNQRARRGLFETYVAMRRYSDAKKQYKILEAFNPQDPYLYWRLARLEESRGNYRGEDQALQKLEFAAKGGAVAVLIYHGLTTSEWLDITSVSQFRQHMVALKKAGFRFITPDEIPAYFAKQQAISPEVRSATPERVVCVTFDDARRDAMALATPIARELGIRLAMHVPVGAIENNEPFMCTWDMLRDYVKSGCWVLGSHMLEAHDPSPIDAQGNEKVFPATSRLWLPNQNRLETFEEYQARLQKEYADSRKIMEEKLGHPVTFIAYPFGDIGQETFANVDNAFAENLRIGSSVYAAGFIQNDHGYAVNGDNPMLYQRYEVERAVTSEELVDHILENHPYYLALVARIKMAALNGKLYQAKDLVDELKQSGYPETLMAKIDEEVHAHLSGQYAADTKTENVVQGPLHLNLSRPYVGVKGEYFQDNLDSRNWRVLGLGGMNLTPNLALEGRAGYGQMKQPLTNSLPPYPTPPPIPDVKLNEKMAGIAPSFTLPNGWLLAGELAGRNFSGTVPTNLNGKTTAFDKTFIQYAVEGQAKLLLPLDTSVRWEHDVMPAARVVAESTTYNLLSANAVYSVQDWWNFWGSGQYYAISDGNARDHLSLISDWVVWEAPGLHAGLGYAYANATTFDSDYWSPYRLNRYFAEMGLRGNYLRTYYNLRLTYGVGKQSVRPDAEQHYQDLLKQAQTQHWPQSAVDQLIATKPEEAWQPVLGLSASSVFKLADHWEIQGEVSYNRVPDYNEISVTGGVKYKF